MEIPKDLVILPITILHPSITLAGGGNVGLGGILSAGVDLFDYARTGKGFSSSLAAGLAAANLIGNVRGLSREGARAGGFNLFQKYNRGN